MARVTRDKEMTVSQGSLYAAITDFESYPQFLPEVVSAKILQKTATAAQVQFELEVVKRFRYVLGFDLKENEVAKWKLIESDFFKTNDGIWQLKQNGSGTTVHYELEVGFGFLVPGWISKKLTETSLPKMFEAFETRAKTLQGKS